MAPSTSTSSPRDHVADANPDLARKKQRLSEDPNADASPGSPLIEVSEPEDIGSNIANAIHIEDDSAITMDPYSAVFDLLHNMRTPYEQIDTVLNDLGRNCYIRLRTVTPFTHALSDHLTLTASQSALWQQRYLIDELDFFVKVIKVGIGFLDGGDLFPHDEELDSSIPSLLQKLMMGMETLCRRIIPMLPEQMSTVLSRRDSAQGSVQPRQLDYLEYIVGAQRVLCSSARTLIHLHKLGVDLSLEALIQHNSSLFFQHHVVSSVATLTRLLAGATREVKGAWDYLKHALQVLHFGITYGYSTSQFPRGEVEEVMDVVKACVLPPIREKHPRALPDLFHSTVVSFGSTALDLLTQACQDIPAWDLYERYVKSSTDAILPELDKDTSASSLLWTTSGEDRTVLARILAASWSLQAARSFICSEIMDVRNVGIESLRRQLVELHKVGNLSEDGFDHPVVQYAIRFLRKNHITEYIFGPESRAGLVSHSANIVGFLAATGAYTDTETDIIWRACSTSVEIDFVKASFKTLLNLLQRLEADHLLYMLKKYCSTPVDQLGPDAIEFLPLLLKELDKNISSSGAVDPLSIPLTCIEILKRANTAESNEAVSKMRRICVDEIARFNAPDVGLIDRGEIYNRCVTEIRERTPYATTAVEIFNLLLDARIDNEEAEHIISVLPVSTAVDELCTFTEANKSRHVPQTIISSAIARQLLILRLMDLAPQKVDKDIDHRLFVHAFGESALSNEARDVAWDQLMVLSAPKAILSGAPRVTRNYLNDYVPSLGPKLITPRLIGLISASLKTELTNPHVRSDVSQLLHIPLWQSLVRFATLCERPSVTNAAGAAILDLLFDYPVLIRGVSLLSVGVCQQQFVRGCIEDLCRDYDGLDWTKKASDVGRRLSLGIDLLSRALHTSKMTGNTYAAVKTSDILILENLKGSMDEVMEFEAHVYSSESEPRLLTIRAMHNTMISELLAQLPARTGASEHRVIVAGLELPHQSDKTLFDLGIRHKGVIMIRPKFTYDVDLDKVLTTPGPVEQEIMAQFGLLENLLDGPEHIAQRAYNFLSQVRPPVELRQRVLFSEATAEIIFPAERPWRLLFSIYVLERHMFDFNRLGVTDNNFVRRTIELLAAYVLDESRQPQSIFMFEIVRVLTFFIREWPKTDDQLTLPPEVSQLVPRLVFVLSQASQMPTDGHLTQNNQPIRVELAAVAYQSLVCIFRVDASAWKAFTEHCDVIDTHRRLLLDVDLFLSSRVGRIIQAFCEDPTHFEGFSEGSVPEFYWNTILSLLPEALQQGVLSQSYFDLASGVFHTHLSLQADETQMRDLVQTLVSEVESYIHSESPTLVIRDNAMEGLLRLLRIAIITLKSFKKPLELDGFSTRLFRALLFPRSDDVQARPLVDNTSRSLTYDLVRLTSDTHTDYETFLDITCEAISVAPCQPGQVFPHLIEEWHRLLCTAAGLNNLGMTCYMNSLLQQLYANLQFRKFILQLPVRDLQQQAVLHQVQQLFARMQNSIYPAIDPSALAQALDIQLGNQEDVHTFSTTLLTTLEESILDNADKASLTKFFTGKSITQIKGECGHVSSRTEPFTELSITVKNKATLHESLIEFVQGEPLEGANKYKCMTCNANDGGRLVDAVRRTCLDEVPDNLTFCLKRFEYMMEGENKVNDHFEFPKEIDMSPYKRNHLEDPTAPREQDKFQLVGVIVHQGSLQFGHYWSYARVPGPEDPDASQWLCLEDNTTRRVNGIQEVLEQSYGRHNRSDNAYVLFYHRESYIQEADSVMLDSKFSRLQYSILPRVEMPNDVREEIERDNLMRQRIAFLFNPTFSDFVFWLLGQFSPASEAKKPDAESTSGSDEDSMLDTPPADELDVKTADLITNYVLLVLLSDPTAEVKLNSLLPLLKTILPSSAAVAGQILHNFAHNSNAFTSIVGHKNAKVRFQLFSAVEGCMSYIQQKDPLGYDSIVPILIRNHASLMEHTLHFRTDRWAEYLGFAFNYARLGVEETYTILDEGYLRWALDIMVLRSEPDIQRRHVQLWNWVKNNNIPLDIDAVIEFVFNMLNEHMDLTYPPDDVTGFPDFRLKTLRGLCLQKDDVHKLFFTHSTRTYREFWVIFQSGSRYGRTATISRWEEYPLGKLVGLFVSDNVHLGILQWMESMLVRIYEDEQTLLTPMLVATLHYCLHANEDSCKGMLKTLSTQLILWRDSETEILNFWTQAYRLRPCATVCSTIKWAALYLSKNLSVRSRTLDWLKQRLFDPPPLSDNPALDAARIYSTRYLVRDCEETLGSAYDRSVPRTRYDAMLAAMNLAQNYLTTLHEQVLERQQQGLPALPRNVLLEYDESRATLASVVRLLDDLSEWSTPETVLPTRPHVRKSVEAVSDGEDEEEEEEEAGSTDLDEEALSDTL